MGNGSRIWARVVNEVASTTTTVVYDRAGFGNSDPAPAGDHRSFHAQAADLNALLDGLGEGPFILVGNSVRGIIIRLAGAARPARVAGLASPTPPKEQADGYYARWFEPSLAPSTTSGLPSPASACCAR